MSPLYALARFNFLSTAIQGESGSLIPDACVYAWSEDLFPLFHHGHLQAAFADEFEVSQSIMSELMSSLDVHWLSGTTPTFYELEAEMDDRFERRALISALRYARLSGRFDSALYSGLLKPKAHPVEAAQIIEPFDRLLEVALD